jgi:hypothetical protein
MRCKILLKAQKKKIFEAFYKKNYLVFDEDINSIKLLLSSQTKLAADIINIRYACSIKQPIIIFKKITYVQKYYKYIYR